MPDTPVWCCVCRHVPFEAILRLRDQGVTDERELQRRTGFGTGCGTCVPYVRLALATGHGRLPILSPAEIDAILARLHSAR
ncbi:MAG: (2Fe-2S)-binding protein [Phycisphaerae bacterium]|nr:(2Fe-2S)-binding protein [Phycisphaerae bacterium]